MWSISENWQDGATPTGFMEETRIAQNSGLNHPAPHPQALPKLRRRPVETARTIVDVDGVDFHYHASKALKNINLQILEKHVTAFIGPSGCGKSTLLRCINRMNDLIDHARVTAGEIRIDGVDIKPRTWM